MKRKSKHCIEKFYVDREKGKNEFYSVIEESSCYDPLLVHEDKNLIGFRFLDNGTDTHNIIYYFGQRVTLDDEEGKYITVDLMKGYLRDKGLEAAIFTKGGVVITDILDGSKTIYEVQQEEKKKIGESFFFDANDFFQGLVGCLGHAGCDITYTVSDTFWPLSEEIDLEDDEEDVAVRTYTIYEDGYELVSRSLILGSNKIGSCSEKTVINLNEIMDVVEPLFQEHPYLYELMKTLKTNIFESKDTDDIGSKMLDIAFDTFDSRNSSRDSFIYEKTRGSFND